MYDKKGIFMERYLRPLAVAVVIIEVCAAVFTVPVLNVYLFMGFRFLMGWQPMD